MTGEGVVAAFDVARGDGHVIDVHGRELYFHCVQIADGSRTIEVGVRVRFQRVVGLRGRDEAAALVRL